jgi:hypothetical protein
MVDTGIDSDAKFRTHAVCPADQHGIFVAGCFEVKDTSKTPYFHISARALSGTHVWLNGLYKRVSGIYRDSGLRIRQAV